MLGKSSVLLIIIISLCFCLSCSDGNFGNELELSTSPYSGKVPDSTIIWVTANATGKLYQDDPLPDPPLTYTTNPDSLPEGVSVIGELVRDPGEYSGTYAIRQGTLELSGVNSSQYTLKFIGNKFSIYGF